MSAFSNYLENNLVDFLMRGQAFSPGTARYVALFTSDPTDAGGGTEVSGGSYARAQLDASATNWKNTQASGTGASSGTGGVTSNAVAITWSAAPTANWGVVTHGAIYDALSGGNQLFQGALAASKTINNGDPAPTFDVGELQLTLA